VKLTAHDWNRDEDAMRTGDIVRMRNATSIHRDGAGKFAASFTYKAEGKNDFVFLCLGTVGHAENFEADKRICDMFRAMGWTIKPPKQVAR
jgi:hypothetical protein